MQIFRPHSQPNKVRESGNEVQQSLFLQHLHPGDSHACRKPQARLQLE